MRPTIPEWGLSLAKVVATRGTCHRRQVGCVLLNSRGRVLATGYNGVSVGMTHCRGGEESIKCTGATAPSGQDLDRCYAIHAEQNALMFCEDIDQIFYCCTTTFPCMTCIKLLLNTGCQQIVYAADYPHEQARDLWFSAHRTIMRIAD